MPLRSASPSPPPVIPISQGWSAPIPAEFAILSVAPSGRRPIPFGVLLLDSATGTLTWKLHADPDALDLDPDDAEYVALLDADFHARTAETTGRPFLESLEDALSGFLRLSEREAVSARNLPRLLDRLFQHHVLNQGQAAPVQPFVTHLPLYGLRAAATKFGEDMEVSESDVDWVPIPPGLKPASDLFIVQVVGRSMEPLIPDGSFCVFRQIRPGSRQGKRLLIEELGVSGTSARFTVKRYTSKKRASHEDEGESWSHEMIRLEPLNREFPAFELDPEAFEGKYRVLGEFVQVLPPDLLDPEI